MLDDREYKIVERQVLEVADDLNLKTHELATILNSINKEEVVANNEDSMLRAVYLIRIRDALRTTYPTNTEYRKLWLHKKCTKLRGRLPIHILLTEGVSGMIQVLSHLDCTFSWDMTGSTHKY